MSVLRDSPHLTDHDDAAVDEYRPISGWAIAALILGLLSPLALVDAWLSLIPLAGLLVAAIALLRIAMLAPAVTGRRAALAGLFLSVFSGVAAATDQAVYWWSIQGESHRFAEAWFGFIARGEPYKAHQLTLAPRYRQPLNGKLEDLYVDDGPWHEEFEHYVEQPVVRRLLALGARAGVRYSATEGINRDGNSITVAQRYAVTGGDAEHGRGRFFVRIAMQRVSLGYGEAAWRMVNVEMDESP